MKTQPASSQYLLLLRQPYGGPDLRPAGEELRIIMARFAEWMKDMAGRGMVVGMNGLENSGTVLRGHHGGTATDGPFAEAKEIIGGYVLISAESLAQAVEASHQCPGLDYGMAVEVRPVKRMS